MVEQLGVPNDTDMREGMRWNRSVLAPFDAENVFLMGESHQKRAIVTGREMSLCLWSTSGSNVPGHARKLMNGIRRRSGTLRYLWEW
jgi:hypothetical protein